MIRRIAAILIALVLVAAGCSDDGNPSGSSESSQSEDSPVTTEVPTTEAPSTTTTTEPDPEENLLGTLIADAPDGLDFYTPPDEIPGEPGDVIWARDIGAVENGNMWLILYHSETFRGESIAVSGVIAVPEIEAPDDGRAVFTWGNGTRGVADECANSRSDDPTGSNPLLEGLLARNMVVVASDYEGLGTPGLHPYTIGESEARGILDAARAAQRFAPAEAGEMVIIGGQSQGGHAAAFANEIAADYSPELEVAAVLGTSPGMVKVDASIVEFLMGAPSFRGIMMMVAASQEAAYGADVAPASRLLTELGVSLLDRVEEGCATELGVIFAEYERDDLFLTDWTFALDNGEDASTLNEPGNRPGAAPTHVMHTRQDGLVPATYVGGYMENACTHGVPLSIDWWDGEHGFIYGSAEAQEAALAWVDTVLAGEPARDDCGDIPQP